MLSDAFGRGPMTSRLSPLRLGFTLSVLGGLPVVAALGMLFGDVPGTGLAVTLFLAGMGVAGLWMHRVYPHDVLGLCNLITVGRLALTASIAALVVAPVPPSTSLFWGAFAVAVLALSLDGVDGWAARRARLASRFGARFDMEVDSLFALVLAVVAYQSGQAGPWVLALGLPHYLFLAAGAIWPWLNRELPDSLSRKAVCVLQIGTLVAFLVPILPAWLLTAAAALAAVALIWSFLRDIRLLIAWKK